MLTTLIVWAHFVSNPLHAYPYHSQSYNVVSSKSRQTPRSWELELEFGGSRMEDRNRKRNEYNWFRKKKGREWKKKDFPTRGGKTCEEFLMSSCLSNQEKGVHDGRSNWHRAWFPWILRRIVGVISSRTRLRSQDMRGNGPYAITSPSRAKSNSTEGKS